MAEIFLWLLETGKIYIHHPVGLDIVTKHSKCFTCGISFGVDFMNRDRGRTCRICGELICNSCSTKNMNLPTAFK